MNALHEPFALIPSKAGQPLPAVPDADGLANVEMLANALDSLAAAQSGGQRGRGHHAAAVFMFGCLAHDEALGGPLCRACARCSGLKCAVAETGTARQRAHIVDWDMTRHD